MSRLINIEPRVLDLPKGQVLFDGARLDEAPIHLFDDRASIQSNAVSGGRGAIRMARTSNGQCVVRFSRRGGLAASVTRDRYLYLGSDRIRTFREWMLLASLCKDGLPVPRPVAAYFERRGGIFYVCGIATELIDNAVTFANVLSEPGLGPWVDAGRCIRRFVTAGVVHPDLNAHNILIAADERVYLIDFDRGSRAPGLDRGRQMLDRLHRSIRKLQGGRPAPESAWRALLSGYDSI